MSEPDGNTLFAWQEDEHGDGRVWGTIATLVPGVNVVAPLVFRDREVCERVRFVAVEHGRKAGKRIRLAEFQRVRVIADDEVIDPRDGLDTRL